MSKYLNPLRLTTLLLFLYCLGHTLSALVSTPPFGAATWFLGGMSLPDQRRWAPITWALFASYAATIVLAVRYLFVVPIVFSSLITLLLGLHGVTIARAAIRPVPAASQR